MSQVDPQFTVKALLTHESKLLREIARFIMQSNFRLLNYSDEDLYASVRLLLGQRRYSIEECESWDNELEWWFTEYFEHYGNSGVTISSIEQVIEKLKQCEQEYLEQRAS